jgi:hypothetical protein
MSKLGKNTLVLYHELKMNFCGQLGEFREEWTRMKFKLEELNTAKSEAFLKLITRREAHLLSNEGVITSVYADPRYKNTLDISDVCTHVLFKYKLRL